MNLKLSTASKISVLLFSLVVLCTTIWFISCKGKSGGGKNIAATSSNSKRITTQIQGSGATNGNIFGTCAFSNIDRTFDVIVTVLVGTASKGYDFFGPGAKHTASNWEPGFNIANLQVPKTGPYIVDVQINARDCMSCCSDEEMTPTEIDPKTNRPYKRCTLNGVPIFKGFKTFIGDESQNAQPISVKFHHCECCK
jgi:hypothetical protein